MSHDPALLDLVRDVPGSFDGLILNGFDPALLGAALTLGKPILALGSSREGLPERIPPSVTLGIGTPVEVQGILSDFLARSGEATLSVLSYGPGSDARKPDIDAALNAHRVALHTAVEKGPLIEENALRNLAWTDSRGILPLKDAARGFPALVLGAGPSLDARLAASFGGLKIAVDRAMKPLVAAGAAPDFAVSIDMDPVLLEMYRGFSVPPKTLLLYDPDCHHRLPPMFPAEKRITYGDGSGIDLWSRSFRPDRGTLPRGLSVGHAAYFLAAHLGASPIILSGVDCAFTPDRTHAGGVPEVGGEFRSDTLRVPGVGGGLVPTSTVFASFIPLFELEIARLGAAVIQTSPFGARIRGTLEMPLEKALSGHPGRPFAPPPLPEPDFDLPAFRSASRDLGSNLEALAGLSGKGRRLLDRGRLPEARAARRDILEIHGGTLAFLGRGFSPVVHRLRQVYLRAERSHGGRESASGTQLGMFFDGCRKAARRLGRHLQLLGEELHA